MIAHSATGFLLRLMKSSVAFFVCSANEEPIISCSRSEQRHGPPSDMDTEKDLTQKRLTSILFQIGSVIAFAAFANFFCTPSPL